MPMAANAGDRCRWPGHAVDTLTILLDTVKLVGEDIRPKAKLKSEIRDHGRQSWIPMDLAGGDS